MKEFELTDDDIIIEKESKVEKRTHNLQNIEQNINDIKQRLSELKLKIEPDKETLEFWNMYHEPEIETMITDLNYYENLLKEIDKSGILPKKYKDLIKEDKK